MFINPNIVMCNVRFTGWLRQFSNLPIAPDRMGKLVVSVLLLLFFTGFLFYAGPTAMRLKVLLPGRIFSQGIIFGVLFFNCVMFFIGDILVILSP